MNKAYIAAIFTVYLTAYGVVSAKTYDEPWSKKSYKKVYNAIAIFSSLAEQEKK
jgi:hypothetical protein